MASSNKTDKLQLPQWQLSDKPEMSDFNDAFEKVEDFKDEFDSHKAESASKHITESGENVNGSYIKFDDGSMICYVSNKQLLYSSGQLLRYQWFFPAGFVTSPMVLVSDEVVYGSGDLNLLRGNSNGNPYSKTNTSVVLGVRFNTSANLTETLFNDNLSSFKVGALAIGRWK